MSHKLDETSTVYLKRINLMIYQLVTNYMSVIITTPQFNFVSFLVNLYVCSLADELVCSTRRRSRIRAATCSCCRSGTRSWTTSLRILGVRGVAAR